MDLELQTVKHLQSKKEENINHEIYFIYFMKDLNYNNIFNLSSRQSYYIILYSFNTMTYDYLIFYY